MEKVALLRCEEYDVDLIEKKLREGFGLWAGMPTLGSSYLRGAGFSLSPTCSP